MDLVIRGRSQDQRGAGLGEDQRCQAGQDHGAREDQSAARQDRTREEQRCPKEKEQQLQAMCTPEGARGTGQGSSTEGPSLKQQFQSKPASDERVGQGAQVF